MSVATQYGADQEVLITAGIRLLARLARVAERACQETGVSLPQYRLLVSVSERPGRASDLAARMGVSRPTLTALVDGLEQGGLLRRRRVPKDRRGIELETTQAGLEAVANAERVLALRMFEIVDRDDVALVADVVGILGAAVDRERTLRVSARA